MSSTYNATPVFSSLTQVGPNIMTASFNLANTLNAAGLVVNDVIQFILLPPGALLTALWFDVDPLYGSGSCVVDIGTDLTTGQGGVNSNGFFSQSAVGTNFTASPAIISEYNDTSYQTQSLPFLYNQETQFSGILLKNATIEFKIHTAGTTAETTGTIQCTAEWTMTNNSGLL